MPVKPSILFLFSDTGGGHRSAAEAIIESLHSQYKDQLSTSMVDIFKDYAPRPLNVMPDLYPKMVRFPQVWGTGYRLSDGHRRARLITASTWPYVRSAIRTLVAENPSDLIVSVHALANAPVLRALGDDRPPFVTVVTDLVTTHALWYHQRTDLCIVPTEEARQRGVRCGLPPEKLVVVGLPVAERFCQPPGNRADLRSRLNWPQDDLVVILVGGGEGMGPIEQTAVAIAEANIPITLVVIAGRNQALKSHLESRHWPMKTCIYGFVHEMPEFMQAADVLITKAGPGTISEALNAGLPMILYSRLPGQEEGNVSFITSQRAGVWAPRPEQIVAALRLWVDNPSARLEAAQACRKLARPQAARQIAQLLARQVMSN